MATGQPDLGNFPLQCLASHLALSHVKLTVKLGAPHIAVLEIFSLFFFFLFLDDDRYSQSTIS